LGVRIIPDNFILHTSPTVPSQRMHARRKTARNSICLRPPSANHALGPTASCTLCFEGERGADLVGSLVELLGIKRGTKAESDAWAEENIVGDGCDTTVVDLDLFYTLAKPFWTLLVLIPTLANETGSSLYLAATSSPTWLPALESQVDLAPASTCALTLW
jgi:hypothetical protein